MIKSQAHKKEMYATQFLLNWSKGPLKKNKKNAVLFIGLMVVYRVVVVGAGSTIGLMVVHLLAR